MKDLNYGYLGPPGTFSEEAVFNYCRIFGGRTKAYRSLRDITAALVENKVDLGLLPLENSLEGSVNLSLDLLYKYPELKLYREIVLPISHFLLTKSELKKEEITKIYSHPQAIAQSGDYLAQNFADAKIVYTESTAAAAEKAVVKKNRVAVGSIRLAEIYDLKIIAKNLQGDVANFTRFVLAANKDKNLSENHHLGEQADGEFKTSIICAPKVNKVGVLCEILTEFAKVNIDLSRIESRPSRRELGEYIFYIDLKGCCSDSNLSRALKNVKLISSYFRILGSYPITVIE